MNAMPKTDAALLERLKESARQGVSREERAKQRVSFVYGNLPYGSKISREDVERQLLEHDL